ncbi:MAG: DUF2336 domain-containing protein [Rhodospirillales bacterium]
MAPDVRADSLTYEEAKELAASADPAVRRALAERADIEPEILYFLAQDEDEMVRRSVADNTVAPRHTYELLAGDQSSDVRAGLASKIAELAPDLKQDELDKVWQSTSTALQALAKDQIVHVRQVLAEALCDLDSAPHDIINILARDAETAVSAPVLEASPVLTDADLLEIIRQGTQSANLSAISKRDGVSEVVSDAIVDTDDTVAIADLLANDSSQIREETLDLLIEKAPDNELWHAPLVSRPILPANAPQRLASFLADQLIETLESRSDLDEKTLKGIKAAVQERLREEAGADENAGGSGNLFDYLEGELPVALVRRLQGTSGLPISVVSSALNAEDFKFVLAALVLRSRVPDKVAKRIFKERNPEGIVSLCWRAELPASLIVGLQKQMARIAPNAVIEPKLVAVDGKGDVEQFPLSAQEMNQRIAFYMDMVMREGSD